MADRARIVESPLRVSLRGGLPSPSTAWDAGAELARVLLAQPGVDACDITVNANRRQVISWARRGGQLRLSVHWALLEHHEDLVHLLTRGDRTAWARLRRRLPEHGAVGDLGPVEGSTHDLQRLLAVERERLPRDAGEVRLGWGRWPTTPPRRSLRLGSCDTGSPPQIRIHPVLDHPTVPAWFVGFVLFHELLHVVFPPIDRGLRREVHPASFRAAERRHPHHAAAVRWERERVQELLERARRHVGR